MRRRGLFRSYHTIAIGGSKGADMAIEQTGRNLACSSFVALITDYLDGAMDPGTVATVEAHLARCRLCATYLGQMRATIDGLGHVPAEKLSEQARADILTAFRRMRA